VLQFKTSKIINDKKFTGYSPGVAVIGDLSVSGSVFFVYS
jgi:hypothetical protein